jgi:hypothetical protein
MTDQRRGRGCAREGALVLSRYGGAIVDSAQALGFPVYRQSGSMAAIGGRMRKRLCSPPYSPFPAARLRSRDKPSATPAGPSVSASTTRGWRAESARARETYAARCTRRRHARSHSFARSTSRRAVGAPAPSGARTKRAELLRDARKRTKPHAPARVRPFRPSSRCMRSRRERCCRTSPTLPRSPAHDGP